MNKIPKIIHYCWFGNGNKNETILKCIESWNKYCKSYKFMEWNESTFNLEKAPLFVKEAYKMKKWAFISDYVRLWALYNYGGIYLDTDVELIKSLDEFLNKDGFSGFSEISELNFQIPAALMGSKPKNSYIKYLLSYYEKKSFILPNGQPDLKANVYIITEMTLSKYKFILNNKYQKIKDYEYYPAEYFTPKFKHHHHIPLITKNTYCIHYHNESWMPWYEKVKIDFLILLSYLGIKKPLRWIFYKTGVLK
jgi:mannosyltransferase OCH1-like enzyme